MKIQLKRSNVLEGGKAKQPTAQQMEYGELAVNYNTDDPTLFIKDSADKIIPIAGNSYILNLIEENQQINISPTPPTTPAPINGDLWLDMSECPPELKVWSDCSGTGEWETIGGGTPKPIDPNPGDGNNTIDPMPPGSGTELDPYVLTAQDVEFGGSTQTAETISFSNQKAGALVQFVDQNSNINGARYTQPVGVIGADGTWSGKLLFTDTPESTDETEFTGLLKIGDSSIYYSWTVTAKSLVAIKKPVVLSPPDGAGIGGDTTYFPKTSVITTVDSGGLGLAKAAEDNTWTSITYGNGKFVAVSEDGTNRVMYSVDAKNWSNAGISGVTSRGWKYVAYGEPSGNPLFVAIAGNGTRMISSPDGLTWTESSTLPSGTDWNKIIWSGDKFVISGKVIGAGKDQAYSTDGINWTNGSRQTGGDFTALAYGNGVYASMNTAARCSYSSDGQTWNAGSNLSEGNPWNSVTWVGTQFVAVASSGIKRVATSTNGQSWSLKSTPSAQWQAVTTDGTRVVAVANSGSKRVMYSDDKGNTWTAVEAPENNEWRDIVYADGLFVAVASSGTNRVMFSPDGIDWTDPSVTLTFTNDKAYDAADNSEVSTIDKVFKAGDKVVGEGNVQFADSPCFSTTTYTGTGNAMSVETGINNEDSKVMLWVKNRDVAVSHSLTDSVRGYNWQLQSDLTNAETDRSGYAAQFTSNGFYLPRQSGYYNDNNVDYVAWNFRGAPGFFDVVTYEGANNIQSIPHSLGSKPGCIIIKALENNSASWAVYHQELGASKTLQLNENAAALNYANVWGDTEPTDSDFTVGDSGWVSGAGHDFVAYLFADTPGLIKCGSYTGDSGSSNVVSCGFRPGWVLIKAATIGVTGPSNTNSSWCVIDSARTTGSTLYPNLSNAQDSRIGIDFTDDGFTLTDSEKMTNDSGQTYIYVAIKEGAAAGQFMPTGVLTEAADASGPSMTLTDVTGEWVDGLTAVNQTEVTEHAPGADQIVFQSSKPATTSGTVNSWGAAEWELSTDSGFVDKQEASVQLQDVDIEQGPTSFTLEADTEYWVHTRYSSSDPAAGPSEWSDANNFKTAGASGGAFGNFSTTLYTGTGSEQTIDTGIDNTKKSLIWQKMRTGPATAHNFIDTERPPVSGRSYPSLQSNANLAQQDNSSGGFRELTSTGFKLGPNFNGENYAGDHVAWNFAAGAGFFDVVTYPGNGTTQDIPHSLGSKPGLIIAKMYDDNDSWTVYHKELGYDRFLNLNMTSAAGTSTTYWHQEPTDSVFSVGSENNTNQSGKNFVAYLFADNPDGGIKCGTFTGTGAVGNYVECGFKPGWVMLKKASGGNANEYGWMMYDTARGMPASPIQNGVCSKLRADTNAAEELNFPITSETSGFTVNNPGSGNNDSGATFIYIAIADATVRFYDENTNSTVTNHTLTKRYGVDPLETDLTKFGIYPLTEQPTYSVDTYVKEGQAYNPVRNYTSELNRANATIEELRTTFAARIAALEVDAGVATEPFAVDGYYPLYYTEASANAASSEGTSHSHTLNETVYYMPDGGTIYHGDYTS